MGKNCLRRNTIADRVATMRCCDGDTVVYALLCVCRPSLKNMCILLKVNALRKLVA